MAANLTRWYCPIEGCPKSYARQPTELWNRHYANDHGDLGHTYEQFKATALTHSLAVEAAMERAQRQRVPTAKAAENSAAASKSAGIDPASLPIVTPEWNDLPTDNAFFEEPREIAKVDPIKKISSTTGEEIELFRLGNQ